MNTKGCPEKSESDKVVEDEKHVLQTILQDARYHNCNCTNWCFATFVDYLKCNRLLGEGHETCNQFLKVYQTVCPNAWVERWKDQLESGTFPVDLPPKENECPGQNQGKCE